MKYTLLQVLVLAAVVTAAVVLGRGPAVHYLGPAAAASLNAAAIICLGVALLAAIPLGVTAGYWPNHVPQAAFAGTGIRLLGTAAVAFAYQAVAKPDAFSFSVCIVGVYLALLVVETGLIVFIVSRTAPRKTPESGVNHPC